MFRLLAPDQSTIGGHGKGSKPPTPPAPVLISVLSHPSRSTNVAHPLAFLLRLVVAGVAVLMNAHLAPGTHRSHHYNTKRATKTQQRPPR